MPQTDYLFVEMTFEEYQKYVNKIATYSRLMRAKQASRLKALESNHGAFIRKERGSNPNSERVSPVKGAVPLTEAELSLLPPTHANQRYGQPDSPVNRSREEFETSTGKKKVSVPSGMQVMQNLQQRKGHPSPKLGVPAKAKGLDAIAREHGTPERGVPGAPVPVGSNAHVIDPNIAGK